VFAVLARLHGLLFQGCLWLLRQPFRGLWAFFLAVLALLGEEFRRWAGLAVSGVLIVLAGKATLNYAPADAKQPLVLVVLALLAIWALAVWRAARVSRANNLVRVRQRQAFRDLAKEVKGGRRDVLEGMARATQRRRVGLVFPSNWRRRASFGRFDLAWPARSRW